MKSYTQGRNQAGKWTKDSSASNLADIDLFANDDYRSICALKDWPWLERLRTISTVATQQFYNLPYDCDQVREVAAIISSIRYVPKQCPNRETWDELNLSQFNSDIPEWWFVFNGQLGIWPTPSTSNNTINITQKSRVIDLSVADYTTGTITSIANGATLVTGSGMAWTSQMVGRFIRFTYVDTANTGDGVWYEIASVPTATTLNLLRPYGGTAISAGSSAYAIGQMPLLPDSFHDVPWIGAAMDFWAKESDDRAAYFKAKHDEKIVELVRTWSSPTTNMVIDDGEEKDIINPNLTIRL